MLISAKYKSDKVTATHVERIDEQSAYCRDLAKDQSNGFTKDRNMRRIGSFPTVTLMEYDRTHPGWYTRACITKDFQDKQKAWKEFLDSDYAKPFMMVEKMKHG
jgi:hypothetical protein